MRYCISGSTCVGKTTLINQLKHHLYYIYEEPCRYISKYGFGINNSNMIETQLAMCLELLNNLISDNGIHSDVIYDRGPLDILSFNKYFYKHGLLNYNQSLYLEFKLLDLLDKFKVFYIPIEFDLIDDGFRHIDNELRQEIDSIMKSIIIDQKLDVIEINGNVEQRMNQIIQVLEG